MKFRLFISSVQSEFAEERRLLKVFVERNPLLNRFFTVFSFEHDVAPQDRRADEVYLEDVGSGTIDMLNTCKAEGLKEPMKQAFRLKHIY